MFYYKALSLARSASTSDSPLVLQPLTAAPEEDSWKVRGAASTCTSFTAGLTASLSSPELWPGLFLHLRPASEHTAALVLAADGWPPGSLWTSLAGGAFGAAEPTFIFCRERDLCKGALFSVSEKQRQRSEHNCDNKTRVWGDVEWMEARGLIRLWIKQQAEAESRRQHKRRTSP